MLPAIRFVYDTVMFMCLRKRQPWHKSTFLVDFLGGGRSCIFVKISPQLCLMPKGETGLNVASVSYDFEIIPAFCMGMSLAS